MMSAFFNRLWYQGRPRIMVYILWPFSMLFWLVSFCQEIGNLTVGGTGKTPLTLGLLDFLKRKNLKVGVIARGYKSKAEYADVPVVIQDQHTAEEVGDEALLIFKEMQVPVAVHHRRVEAVKALLAAYPNLDLILSDDGLQHLKLPRAMEIVVVDGQRQFGNGHLLPAGPLREPLSRLKKVDFVLHSGVEFKLEPQGFISLDLRQHVHLNKQGIDFWAGKNIHAVAGIGHPERFFNSLAFLGIHFIPHVFPDHHCFTQADFSGFQEDVILMTAKDAVKCTEFNLAHAYYLNTKVRLDAVFEGAFWQKLRYIIDLES